MKSVAITLLGLSAINYLVPATMQELADNAAPFIPATEGATETPEQTEARREIGMARVFEGALQAFMIPSQASVREKAIELISETYGIKPYLRVGKIDVVPVVWTKEEEGKTGTVKHYASVADPKKIFKKDSKLNSETDTAFIERVLEEKKIELEALRPLFQKAAEEVPYSAKAQRSKGSVASKPVGKKWLAKAQKVVDANNHVEVAARISKYIGKPVDVTGPDKVKQLALGMSAKAIKEAKEKEEEFDSEIGITVVDATKSGEPTETEVPANA